MTSAEQGDAPDPHLRTRIVLRPLGSSLPLGFFAFGIGVLLVGLLDLGVLPEADTHQVALELLTFSAPLELIASVLAFLARDSGAGTALGLFGATWASQGVGLLTAPPGSTSPVTGAMSLGLAVVLLALATASVAGKPALGVLLLLATARMLLSGLYDLGLPTGLRTASGVLSMGVVAVSAYGGLALLLEDTRGRTVLPTGRVGRARASLEEGLRSQTSGLASEAGVRNQL